MKDKLLYIDVCILKVVAILMVVIGHYYRFFDDQSPLNGLKSIGFFGAALFAFLSGYLVEINSEKITGGGYKWLVRKISTVYVPYLIVNLFSLPVYRTSNNILLEVFLGVNDGVLWYVPFILIFYLIYFICAINSISKYVFIIIGCIAFTILMILGFDSQWYTSIGALLLGVYIGKAKGNRFIQLKVYSGLFLLFSVLSIKFGGNANLKDLFTAMSGLGFCGVMFIVFMVLPIKEADCYKSYLLTIGTSAFWVYLLHMKVGLILDKLGILTIASFVVLSIIVALLFNAVYSLAQRIIKRNILQNC